MLVGAGSTFGWWFQAACARGCHVVVTWLPRGCNVVLRVLPCFVLPNDHALSALRVDPFCKWLNLFKQPCTPSGPPRSSGLVDDRHGAHTLCGCCNVGSTACRVVWTGLPPKIVQDLACASCHSALGVSPSQNHSMLHYAYTATSQPRRAQCTPASAAI